LRLILNSGHTRELAFVARVNPDTLQVERFSTFAPKALAGIGRMAATLMDRSIIIAMQRRKASDKVTKLRDAEPDSFTKLRAQLMRWSIDHLANLPTRQPTIPEELNDREGDIWQPLLAIAEEIGEDCAKRARQAAKVLSEGEEAEAANQSNYLLASLEELYREQKKPFLPTGIILAQLNKDEEAPWADREKKLTAEKLASILRAYKVKSKRRGSDKTKATGYFLEDLLQVFERYRTQSPLPTR
jgi:putative DNA primase/helicase